MHGWAAAPLAIPSICRSLPLNSHRFSAGGVFCTAKLSTRQSFVAHNQALAAVIPATHDLGS
jgi:hypothetical protein